MTSALGSREPRALILGGAGMLGHKLWQEFRDRMPTYVTMRRSAAAYERLKIFDERRIISGVDATRPKDLYRAITIARPTVIINAVGIIKQLREAHDPIESLAINSLLPHELAELCRAAGARFIHLSTDCVFSGERGGYKEADRPDPVDLYGRTKHLGEVSGPGALTIRTSIIGREIHSAVGLIEWLLSNRGGRVRGFRRAIYTGFTTREMARILADIVLQHPALEGVWQVSSQAISKYDLLTLVNAAFEANVVIEPDDAFYCDRSLDSSRFRAATGYEPPSWPAMISDLRDDPTPYDTWKR